jgi:hypothetical protein
MGVVYKTTNLINGKMYVGSDSKNNDKYLGSGKLLNRAIKKYGREHFVKNILEVVDDTNLLKEREEFWLKELDCANSDKYYNIVPNYLGGKTSTCFSKNNVPWNAGKIGKCNSLLHMKGKKETEIYSEEALERRRLGRIKRSETLRQKAAAMTDEERKAYYGRNKNKRRD